MKYLWSDESQLSVTGLSGHNKSAAEIYASLVSSISVNVRDAGPWFHVILLFAAEWYRTGRARSGTCL